MKQEKPELFKEELDIDLKPGVAEVPTVLQAGAVQLLVSIFGRPVA